ncbi:hypothetical protein L6R52_37985, partial [Myxococcota bacterium]|nr:hypothetical protein [Myxococcota bacterium]
FVLLDSARSPELVEVVATRPGLEARIEGTAPAPATGPAAENFRARFRERHGHLPRLYAAETFDAAHVLVLLGAAAGTAADGAALARGFDLFASGAPARLVPTELTAIAARIARREAADLEGASGALDLDLTTGEVRSGFVRWQVAPGGERPFPTTGRWIAAEERWE